MMRFFDVRGAQLRLSVGEGHLLMQSRQAGRLGPVMWLFPVPPGVTVEECVEALNAFELIDGFYCGVFFGFRAWFSIESKENTIGFFGIIGGLYDVG